MLAGGGRWRDKTTHVSGLRVLAPGLVVVEGRAQAQVVIAGLPFSIKAILVVSIGFLGKFVGFQRLDAQRIAEVGTPGLDGFIQVVSGVYSGEGLTFLLQELVNV